MGIIEIQIKTTIEGVKTTKAIFVDLTKGVLALTKDDEGWSIIHIPSGRCLPGIFKTERTASTIAQGWWKRLTLIAKTRLKTLSGEITLYDLDSPEAIEYLRDQIRKLGLRK